MSKQTSLLTVKREMRGISFYERNGLALARKATAPERNRILTIRSLNEHSDDRLTATIAIDDITKARIKAPKDTTHVKLVVFVGIQRVPFH